MAGDTVRCLKCHYISANQGGFFASPFDLQGSEGEA